MDLEIGSDPVPRPVPVVEPLLEEELPGVVKLTLKMQENAWRHIAYCLVARSKTDMTNSPKKIVQRQIAWWRGRLRSPEFRPVLSPEQAQSHPDVGKSS